MSDVPRARLGRARLGWAPAVGRELPVLALVALVTYGAASYATVPWAPGIGCEPSSVWLVSLGAVAPAVVRRWVPTLSLLASAVLFAWYPGSGIALALMAYGAAARISSPRRRVGVLAVAALTPFVIGLIGSGYQWLTTAIVFGVSAVVCVIVPAMVRILLGQRDRLFGALRERASYLEENYRLADSSARLAERTRIAGEMHDLLGHRLSLISLYAGALELDAARNAPTLADEAKLVRGTVFQAMEELRTLLGILRSGEHDAEPARPDEEIGTTSDIGALVMQSRAAGVPVELSWAGDDLVGVAPPVRRAVHRIVREGLTNVHRHALGAAPCVVVERRASHVRVAVRNTAVRNTAIGNSAVHNAAAGNTSVGNTSVGSTAVGDRGPASAQPAGTGRGLVGVQERVRMLGGEFSAGPLPDGGFELAAVLPLRLGAAETAGAGAVLRTSDGAGGRTEVRRHRSPRSASTDRLTRIGMAVVLAGGLIGSATLVAASLETVSFAAADESDNGNPYADFDAVRIGARQSQVNEQFGGSDELAAAAARGIEPARPPRTDACSYWYIRISNTPGTIERFCYRGGTLVDKTRFGIG